MSKLLFILFLIILVNRGDLGNVYGQDMHIKVNNSSMASQAPDRLGQREIPGQFYNLSSSHLKPNIINPVDNNISVLLPDKSIEKPADTNHNASVTRSQHQVETFSIAAERTKIRSCIYGCQTITLRPRAYSEKFTAITALPVTLPCSLLICPPCSCTSKTISITGCPAITTITPPPSSVTVTADFTITFITVTVTVTSCTLTTCPTTATTTLLSTSTITSTRPQTTITVTSTLTTTRSSTTLITPDRCGCPKGYNNTTIPSSLPTITCPGAGCTARTKCSVCPIATITAELRNVCHKGGSCNVRNLINNLWAVKSTDSKSWVNNTMGIENPHVEEQYPGPNTNKVTTGPMCSTLIICDNSQFSCPGQHLAEENLFNSMKYAPTPSVTISQDYKVENRVSQNPACCPDEISELDYLHNLGKEPKPAELKGEISKTTLHLETHNPAQKGKQIQEDKAPPQKNAASHRGGPWIKTLLKFLQKFSVIETWPK